MFDDGFPRHERLPRRINAVITDKDKTAAITINGRPAGDPLRDNRYSEDGYRFHDVLHLAHATYLGWSPTLRSILKKTRDSQPTVKQKEDGKRAVAIEEGMVAMTFSYAERNYFLEGQDSVAPHIHRRIEEMTSELEVASMTRKDWDEAILEGYSCWRQITAQGAGRVLADLNKRTLRVTGLRPPGP